MAKAKKYRVLKEVLGKDWKVGQILEPEKLEGHDINWMLTSSKCIEEVAPVEVFQTVVNGIGTEGESSGSENVAPPADNPPPPDDKKDSPPPPPAKPTTPATASKK